MTIDEILLSHFPKGITIEIEGTKLQEICRQLRKAERERNHLQNKLVVAQAFLEDRPLYIDITI